jgi:thioredoxin-related protein
MPERAAAYLVGTRLPAAPSLYTAGADHTLFVFLRSGCAYCTASMPFYTKLNEVRKASRVPVAMTAVSTDSQSVLESYLATHGLPFDRAVSISASEFARYNIRGTPTLLYVDRRGTVRRAWLGKLPEAAEREILTLLSGI